MKIPKGKVVSYGEMARALGSKGARAVGNAMRANEHPETIPCYKVVRSNGEIGGYCGEMGSLKKIAKLEADGVEVVNGRVDLGRFGWTF